jgi:uncharacterized protein YndB with AHSA1/START domain
MAQTTRNSASAAAKSAPPAPLVVSRLFAAPRELVFRAWSSAEHLKRWFCPAGYSVPAAEADFRVGGAFVVCMRSPEGRDHWTRGTYTEIVANSRLVIDMNATGDDGQILFRAHTVVAFADEAHGTRLEVTQSYTILDPIAAPMIQGAQQGWAQTLDRLRGYFDARIVVAGAVGEVGLMRGSQCRHRLPVRTRPQPRAFLRADDTGRTAAVMCSGRNTCPSSFHTFTVSPSSASPRSTASAGFISSTGARIVGRESAERRSDALVGGRRNQRQRICGGQRPVPRQACTITREPSVADSSSTLPLGVLRRDVLEQHGFISRKLHLDRPIDGHLARAQASACADRRVQRSVHEFGVAVPERRIRKAELCGKPAKNLGVRQALADRRMTARRAADTAGRRRVDIRMFEVRAGGQHHIRVRHGVGHGHFDADREQILARQARFSRF